MTLKYEYKMKKTPYTYGSGRECGPYQCEEEDFFEFFVRMVEEIQCAIVTTQDGKKWIGYWKFDRFVWKCVTPKPEVQLSLDFGRI